MQRSMLGSSRCEAPLVVWQWACRALLLPGLSLESRLGEEVAVGVQTHTATRQLESSKEKKNKNRNNLHSHYSNF